ncbi:MAG: hypothetical protein RJQ14_13985 [Marinoscillum sp.]
MQYWHFLIALISIWIKIYNHFKYLNLLPESIEIPSAFGALSPLFLGNSTEEEKNEELKKLARTMDQAIFLWGE